MFLLLASCSFRQGDWRGISRHFVQSRTPTQVASHAQKYFIRQNNMNKRKRRSSLFDIVNEAPEEPAKAGGRVDGVAGGAGGASAIPGGLSMAFASHLGGYNPTGVAPPATFSAHGANPPGVAAASATRGDKSASTSDIGTAGEAAAATIAALSMAGSPAATAGYRAAAAAAAAPGARGGSFPGVGRASELDAATKAAQAQAQAAQVNGFAAMMAQMGAMGQMGQMGSFPPPANWMATYHQFLSQMTAAGGGGAAGGGYGGEPVRGDAHGRHPGGRHVPAGHDGGHANAGRGARVPGKRARGFVPPDGGARRARRAGERPSRGLRRGESRDGDGVTVDSFRRDTCVLPCAACVWHAAASRMTPPPPRRRLPRARGAAPRAAVHSRAPARDATRRGLYVAAARRARTHGMSAGARRFVLCPLLD